MQIVVIRVDVFNPRDGNAGLSKKIDISLDMYLYLLFFQIHIVDSKYVLKYAFVISKIAVTREGQRRTNIPGEPNQ